MVVEPTAGQGKTRIAEKGCNDRIAIAIDIFDKIIHRIVDAVIAVPQNSAEGVVRAARHLHGHNTPAHEIAATRISTTEPGGEIILLDQEKKEIDRTDAMIGERLVMAAILPVKGPTLHFPAANTPARTEMTRPQDSHKRKAVDRKATAGWVPTGREISRMKKEETRQDGAGDGGQQASDMSGVAHVNPPAALRKAEQRPHPGMKDGSKPLRKLARSRHVSKPGKNPRRQSPALNRRIANCSQAMGPKRSQPKAML